jgi:hypothetical protein
MQLKLLEGLMDKACRLCSMNKPLCDSHLLPKAEYKRLTSPKHAAPVLLYDGKAQETNRQVSRKLLCRDCETLFEKHGETPVLKVNHHPDGKFCLRDAIEQLNPVRVIGSKGHFSASQLAPSFDIDAFRYFAVSVFWRGSVVSWPMEATRTYTGSIKAGDELALRRYLLGQGLLPGDIAFRIQVDTGRPGVRVMHSPTFTETQDAYGFSSRHTFVIPGLRFHMFVGGLFKYRRATDNEFPMFVAIDFENSPIYETYINAHLSTTATGKLARSVKSQDLLP